MLCSLASLSQERQCVELDDYECGFIIQGGVTEMKIQDGRFKPYVFNNSLIGLGYLKTDKQHL